MSRGEILVNGWASKMHARARWIVLGIALTVALLAVVLSAGLSGTPTTPWIIS